MKLRVSEKKQARRILILLIVILFFGLFTIRGVVIEVLGPVSAPLTRLGTSISESIFWWNTSKNITSEELERLYEQRDALAVDIAEYEMLLDENKALHEELGFVERTGFEYVAANILSKSISSVVSKVVIDVGSDHGIELGSAVVAGEGIFVGKVTELGRRSSTVTSLTDPNLTVAVSLLNESRTIGVASGAVGDLVQIDYIPIDESVSVDDLVVTSGLEAPVPSGLLVGVVSAIHQETGSPFQQAVLDPLADVRRLSHVLVLIQ